MLLRNLNTFYNVHHSHAAKKLVCVCLEKASFDFFRQNASSLRPKSLQTNYKRKGLPVKAVFEILLTILHQIMQHYFQIESV